MTTTELLRLLPCLNCGRDDRLALKTWRRKFFIECDCGTVSGSDGNLVVAVGWWNSTPHWTPNAGIMCRDRATGDTVKIPQNQ